MFEEYRHKRKIANLQRRFDLYEEKIRAAVAVAERDGKRDDREALISELLYERQLSEDEIGTEETTYLLRQARSMMVPAPDTGEEDAWVQSHEDGRYRLNYRAMNELRNVLRAERRLRAEPVKTWLALAIGIIGALTGLVAAFR